MCRGKGGWFGTELEERGPRVVETLPRPSEETFGFLGRDKARLARVAFLMYTIVCCMQDIQCCTHLGSVLLCKV